MKLLLKKLPFIALIGCLTPTITIAECPSSQEDLLDDVWTSFDLEGQTRFSEYELTATGAYGHLVVTRYDGAERSHVTTNWREIYPQRIEFPSGSSLSFQFEEHMLAPEVSPGARFTVDAAATFSTANGDRRSPGRVSFVVSDEPYMVSFGECTYEAYELTMRMQASDFNMDQTTRYHFIPALVLPVAFSFGPTNGSSAERPEATNIRISTERF